jgi:hypothetical protein
MSNTPIDSVQALQAEVEMLEKKTRLLQKKLELHQELRKLETELAAFQPVWFGPTQVFRNDLLSQGPPPWYSPRIVTSTNAVVPGVNRNGDKFVPPAEATSGYIAPDHSSLLTMSSEELQALKKSGATPFMGGWREGPNS